MRRKRRGWPPVEERDDDGDGVLRDVGFAHARDAWPERSPLVAVPDVFDERVTESELARPEADVAAPRGVCGACGGEGYLVMESGDLESETLCVSCDGTGWTIGGIDYTPGEAAIVDEAVDPWARDFPGEVDPEYDPDAEQWNSVSQLDAGMGASEIAARLTTWSEVADVAAEVNVDGADGDDDVSDDGWGGNAGADASTATRVRSAGDR